MRVSYIYHRLRKYKRKKFKKSDPLALKYWRYHHKLYGNNKNLWEITE